MSTSSKWKNELYYIHIMRYFTSLKNEQITATLKNMDESFG